MVLETSRSYVARNRDLACKRGGLAYVCRHHICALLYKVTENLEIQRGQVPTDWSGLRGADSPDPPTDKLLPQLGCKETAQSSNPKYRIGT